MVIVYVFNMIDELKAFENASSDRNTDGNVHESYVTMIIVVIFTQPLAPSAALRVIPHHYRESTQTVCTNVQ